MNLSAQWVVGFVDGEGCFFVGISKNRTTGNFQVLPEFTVVQHEKNIQILYGLKTFFDCGVVRKNRGNQNLIWCYRVRQREHILNVIIPFFEKHPIKGQKWV